jgi:PKHD-type hydroxylase
MKNFYAYVKNLFTADQCQEIVEIYENNKEHTTIDAPAHWKNCSTIILPDELLGVYSNIIKYNVTSINQDFFGFDLFQHQFLVYHLNTYTGNQNYNLHVDAMAGSPKDMKLTAIVNLSCEPYIGGEFTFPPFGEEGNIPEFDSQVGCMLVFPSFFAHKVNNVTQGTRRTLVTWFEGPNWK